MSESKVLYGADGGTLAGKGRPVHNYDLSDVLVYIYEPMDMIRREIRMALGELGITEVRDSGDLTFMKELLRDVPPDVLICDVDLPEGSVVKLIRAIRHNELGGNPFYPIVMMSWQPSSKLISEIARSGTDDILIKPVARAGVVERVMHLINKRKPFVVTSDYVGPDRRKTLREGDDKTTFDVPNTFRSKALGEAIDIPETERQIAEAVGKINLAKIDRHAERVAMLARLAGPVLRGDEPGEPQTMMMELAEILADMRVRMRKTRFAHVSDLARSMGEVIDRLLQDILGATDKDIALLEPMSMAILKGIRPERGEDALARTIANRVSTFQVKRQNPATIPTLQNVPPPPGARGGGPDDGDPENEA